MNAFSSQFPYFKISFLKSSWTFFARQKGTSRVDSLQGCMTFTTESSPSGKMQRLNHLTATSTEQKTCSLFYCIPLSSLWQKGSRDLLTDGDYSCLPQQEQLCMACTLIILPSNHISPFSLFFFPLLPWQSLLFTCCLNEFWTFSW